jgi:hypothetical protein
VIRITIAAALLAAAASAGAEKQPLYWVSAPKLYAECFGAPPSDGCYGFIAGVTAGVNGASLALTNRMPLCFTDTTTLEQVVETIVEDMRKQPENWTQKRPAEIPVLGILKAKFSCAPAANP